MEIIDIVDESGIPTGETKLKKLVHIDGDRHRTVHVWFINDNNEILLQRRSKTKLNYPNLWSISVSGHIFAGESPITGALREIEEEIGISLVEKDLLEIAKYPKYVVLNEGTYIDNEVSYVYLVRKNIPIEKMKKQDDELEDLKYFSIIKFKSWVKDKNPNLVMHPKEFEILLRKIDNS